MKFEITGRPEFHFRPSMQQVAILMGCSGRHYDSVCRYASLYGGFLVAWRNHITFGPGPCCASWRELDICLKILEGAAHDHRAGLLSDDDIQEASAMRDVFRLALDSARAAMGLWKTELA